MPTTVTETPTVVTVNETTNEVVIASGLTQGIPGVQGWQGPTTVGTQGPQGSGSQGFQGSAGIGTQGPQGNGSQGFQGSAGIGTQGPQGNGSQGYQGFQGQASQGTQGFQGNIGTNGLQGNQGLSGLQGFQGQSGSNGLQGPQGFQGNAGQAGLQGTAGNGGLQGWQGPAASGYVPYTGASSAVVLGANTLSTTSGLISPTIYPAADSTTAVQINKADGTTNVLNVDTTNGRVGIGITPTEVFHVYGDTTNTVVIKIENANSSGATELQIYAGTAVGSNKVYPAGFAVASLANRAAFGAGGTAVGVVVFTDGNATDGGAGTISIRAGGYETTAENVLFNKDGSYFTHGKVGIGLAASAATAKLHLAAGTATASTAPLKLTSGTLNTTAEAGAIEFLTDDFYVTITTAAARKTVAWIPSQTDVTASRALDTTYTNTGNRSIMVMATVRCAVTLAGGNSYVQGKSDSSTPPTTIASGLVGIQAGLLGEDNSFQISFVVAPGKTYRIDSAATNGTCVKGNWFETVY